MRFDLDMPAWKWPFYVARHPFEGFEDLRWKKAYNTKVSLVIVLCFFVITVCQQVMTGFLFNDNYVKIFNIVPLLVQTVILFFTWVIGNWSLCTLFDGEGSVKAITSVSAYSLVPYLITQVVVILASNVLLKSEGAFIIFFQYLGILWTVVLMISGIKTVHQYSVPKTLLAMVHCCGNGNNPVPARAVTQLVPAGLHLRFLYLYRVDVQIQFVSGGVTEDDKNQKKDTCSSAHSRNARFDELACCMV